MPVALFARVIPLLTFQSKGIFVLIRERKSGNFLQIVRFQAPAEYGLPSQRAYSNPTPAPYRCDPLFCRGTLLAGYEQAADIYIIFLQVSEHQQTETVATFPDAA